ncbi:hypothetical protein CVT25_008306, partial [Psilocybe cyanescens]
MEIDDETPVGPSFKTPSPLPSPPLYSPSPPRRPSGLIARKTRMPLRFRDELPASPPVVIVSKEFDIKADEDYFNNTGPSSSQVSQSGDISYVTEPNWFGVFCTYKHGPPVITPDKYFTLSSVSDSVSIASDPIDTHSKTSWWSSFGSLSLNMVEKAKENWFAPFLNASAFLLMAWFYNGSSIKSYADIDKLVHDVILHEEFKASDFNHSFSTAREAERMDKAKKPQMPDDDLHSELLFSPNDGWIQGSISIPLPCDGVQHASEEESPHFVLDGIWYRRPLEVIKQAFSEPATERFHITPFTEYWKPSKHEP